MTVTYSLNVANAKLTGFSKLLLRWKGSIYKLLYREMIIFCGLYYSLSLSYRCLLNSGQKEIFEKCVKYCRAFTNLIPLSFVLGFYVSIVVTRWWQQFMQIPWPDKAVLLISGYVRGNDERGRIIRRTLARYLVLMQVLTFQAVSTSVRRRFPTLDHIQEVGLFTAEERIAYDEIIGTHGKWWAPAQWFTALVIRARKAGRIKHDYLMDKIIEELHAYRTCCGMMFAYDWISIPLVYTQTVTIATYTYFLANIMGRQYLDPVEGQQSHDVDFYIPIFTILEFFFFMGWLKVAEQLINPYGEDDDDFELNWCLDRNLLISYMIVDDMYDRHPKLVPDMYWDKPEPMLPYTKSSMGMKLHAQPHMGSTINLNVEPEDFIPMETIMEEDREDIAYTSTPNTAAEEMANTAFNWNGQKPSSFVQIEIPSNNLNNTVNANEQLDNLNLKAETDSIRSSKSGLKFLHELRDSKFMNMIIGSSHDNIHQPHGGSTNNKQGQLSTFMLKTPRKRIRTNPNQQDSSNNLTNRNTNNSNLIQNLNNLNMPQIHSANSNQSIPGPMNSSNNPVNNNIPSSTNLGIINSSIIGPINNNLFSSQNQVSNSSNRKLLKTNSSDLDSHILEQSMLKHRNQLSRISASNSYKYKNLPTAPIILSSSNKLNSVSPILNCLKRGFNRSINSYRDLNKQSDHNQQSANYGSAFSLRSKFNDNNEQLVNLNGFRFPEAYVPPLNPHQYYPVHLKPDLVINRTQSQSSNLPNDSNSNNQESNNNLIEITISPASSCSHNNTRENESLISLNEENLITMENENFKIRSNPKFANGKLTK